MSKKTIAIGLIVLGLIIIFVGLGANLLGLSPSQSIGWKKELLAGVGLLISLGGIGLLVYKKS
ncbi:MAG TPA: hypothetical protein VF326_05925 [Anaerolineaceae bacterium]|jgi:hypothetical protein